MDWFRWWHGTITDPKFQSVARKAGTSVANVIAVWAALLEHASSVTQCDADVTRGDISHFDCEDFDVLLGLRDGESRSILEAMEHKNIIGNGRISRWDDRQQKRDDSSTERTRAYRERKKNETLVTQCDADVTHCDADVTHCDAPDKIRLEKNKSIYSPLPPRGESKPEQSRDEPRGFAEFWGAYPKKKSKNDAISAWRKLKPDDALIRRILDAVEALKRCDDWMRDAGRYIPHPASWLNAGGWEDEIQAEVQGKSIFDLNQWRATS